MQLLQVPTTESSTSIRELNRNKVIIFACCWPVAKPARQFGHAMQFKSLSLFISLEIDSLYGL